ncbi:hypothetical protein RclHR1_00550002 [Rhizophagus clarus]|uniref:Uncharacterized protein n=1 Tax=Rhizophagus clarus TaxID=94130 RepID=A0A2Z6SF54_9GLOM|nr:hypothetical protein RclHR1_00550002 [Rhizophagus clarus]
MMNWFISSSSDSGLNNIKFILDTKPFSSDSSPLTTIFQVYYSPLLQNPPLNLAILVAKDSKEIIDVPEERSDENKLESVKAKLRCAAYLWQAFTAEQMSRNGFGRRVFRLDEEWTEDTISNQNPGLRQTARIHIIRSSYTHLTHAWPRHLEEVASCFQDNVITDETRLSNDSRKSGTWWRCCNIGIDVFLCMIELCFTATHSPSGIMSRGFNHLNRTFTVKETNNPLPITPSDEEGALWYRSNVIRFRFHPCFRLPLKPPAKIEFKDVGASFWILNKILLIKSLAGIVLIEFYFKNKCYWLFRLF